MKITSPIQKRVFGNDDNLVPLINIIFLLLIFFMVAGNITASDVLRDASRLGGKGPADKSAATAVGARTSRYAQVVSHLARHKHYPIRARRMRHEAVVMLSFVVARDGSVRQAEITGPSQHRALNKAVQDMLERAKPLPVFPEELPGEEISLSIPVAFKLR